MVRPMPMEKIEEILRVADHLLSRIPRADMPFRMMPHIDAARTQLGYALHPKQYGDMATMQTEHAERQRRINAALDLYDLDTDAQDEHASRMAEYEESMEDDGE